MFQIPQQQNPFDAHDFSKTSFEESIDIQDSHQSKIPEEKEHDFEVDHDAVHLLRKILEHIDDMGQEILAKMFSKTEMEASSFDEVFIEKLEGLEWRPLKNKSGNKQSD